MRLPTRTRVHCAVHVLFQQAVGFGFGASPLTRKSFFLLVREFHEQSLQTHSMEVRTTEVVHCFCSLALRLFLTVSDDQTEQCTTLSSGGIPLKSSAAKGTSDSFMAFSISRTTIRDLLFGRSASPLYVSIQRRETALAPTLSLLLRRTGYHTPMTKHQLTSTSRASLTRPAVHQSRHKKDVLCQAVFVW